MLEHHEPLLEVILASAHDAVDENGDVPKLLVLPQPNLILLDSRRNPKTFAKIPEQSPKPILCLASERLSAASCRAMTGGFVVKDNGDKRATHFSLTVPASVVDKRNFPVTSGGGGALRTLFGLCLSTRSR